MSKVVFEANAMTLQSENQTELAGVTASKLAGENGGNISKSLTESAKAMNTYAKQMETIQTVLTVVTTIAAVALIATGVGAAAGAMMEGGLAAALGTTEGVAGMATTATTATMTTSGLAQGAATIAQGVVQDKMAHAQAKGTEAESAQGVLDAKVQSGTGVVQDSSQTDQQVAQNFSDLIHLHGQAERQAAY